MSGTAGYGASARRDPPPHTGNDVCGCRRSRHLDRHRRWRGLPPPVGDSPMKRPLILVILLIAALGAALPYAPVDFLKFPIERALERGLGRQVQVDRVSLTLFSGPGVSLDGVTIQEDSRAGIEPFAYANTLDARLSLLPLLRGHLEFSSLHLNDATFNLVKPADAPWNFQMLLDRARLSAAGRPGDLPSLALPTIKVRGGRVNFKFSQTKS